MIRTAPLSLAIALFIASGSVAHLARGDKSTTELDRARELFGQAEKDEDAGAYQVALEKFQRVGTVKMTPGVRFHIAHCEEGLGLLVRALADYTKAEDDAKAAPENPASRAVLDNVGPPLAALRGRVPRLRVAVPHDVNEIVVMLDGQPLDEASLDVLVPIEAGAHRIEASAKSRLPFTTTVTLNEHDVTVIEVKLLPEPPPRKTDVPIATTSHAVPIAVTGGAVVLVAAGFGAYAIAGQKQSDARTACASMVNCDSLRGPVRAWDRVALGTWIGGAALASVAIVLWAKSGDHATSAKLVIDPRSLRVEGKF